MAKNHDWAQKNARRRSAYDGKRVTHREARSLRRQCGGAFGLMRPGYYNQLVVGTTGTARATRNEDS